MAASEYLFTSESVSEGHPDKVCDRISDEIVDLYLGEYPFARVACETLATTNRVVIAGEVRPGAETQITPERIVHVARQAIKKIGYAQDGFHWENVSEDPASIFDRTYKRVYREKAERLLKRLAKSQRIRGAA